MSEVIFPSVNLQLNINKIAFQIFEVEIYWYAIFIIFAIMVGVIFSKLDNGKYNIKFDTVLELLLFVIPISIVCARLYYVIFNLPYYTQNPMEILNLRDGGLAIYGGIIGGIAVIYVYGKIRKIRFLNLTDYIVPYLALGQAIGRWGNFFNVEAYGIQTNSIFRMGIIESEKYIEVHPTFLYESVCNFIIFIILYLLRNKRKYKGQITYIYLTLYGLIRFIIEGLRIDSLMMGMFRVSQVLSITLFFIFGIILIYKRVEKPGNEK
ncbi:MAG: prolipoprotein diacylglyceryl transferase [Clostridia bacterium]|nr:prolipoprotein diacylglyceryl transferase [Clostridia bacterium]